jgi:hypothetical protein
MEYVTRKKNDQLVDDRLRWPVVVFAISLVVGSIGATVWDGHRIAPTAPWSDRIVLLDLANTAAHMGTGVRTLRGPEILSALVAMGPVAGKTALRGANSSLGSPHPSSAYGVVSYDDTDSTTITGYAMRALNGGCTLVAASSNSAEAWSVAHQNCDGADAIGRWGSVRPATVPPILTAPSR